jgi:hypothetical protein
LKYYIIHRLSFFNSSRPTITLIYLAKGTGPKKS